MFWIYNPTAILFFIVEGVWFWRLLTGGPEWYDFWLPLLAAHFMHAQLIAFHEAAHFNLILSRLLNEFMGLLCGTSAGLSLTGYRALHKWHHSSLGTPRDEELWPFTDPAMPRWRRCLAAFFELTLGVFYTPMLF